MKLECEFEGNVAERSAKSLRISDLSKESESFCGFDKGGMKLLSFLDLSLVFIELGNYAIVLY